MIESNANVISFNLVELWHGRRQGISDDISPTITTKSIGSNLVVRLASTEPIPLVALNTSNSGILTIDGRVAVPGDTILLTNQSDAVENGVWTIADTTPAFRPIAYSQPTGLIVFVLDGINHAETIFVCIDGTHFASSTVSNATLSLFVTQGVNNSGYLTATAAATTYQTIPSSPFLMEIDADAKYVTSATAASTYQAIPASPFVMESDADAKYVTPATAASTYQTKPASPFVMESDADAKYVTPATAASTYLTPTAGDDRYVKKSPTTPYQWTVVDKLTIFKKAGLIEIPVESFSDVVDSWAPISNTSDPLLRFSKAGTGDITYVIILIKCDHKENDYKNIWYD
jgi:hypothetical protein